MGTPAGTESRTVLVVDDDEGIRDVLGLLLEEVGYEVLFASGGETALDVLSRHRPDVMLIDLRMPGMSGWDLIRECRLRFDCHAIPVIVVSGAGDQQERVTGIQVQGFVNKPFDFDQLLAIIEEQARLTRVSRNRGRVTAANVPAGGC